MEDKLIDIFKKYSISVDTEYYVYYCLFDEDLSNIADEVVKLFRQPAVIPSLPNGKRVLAALKELSECFTDEERKTMFGNDAKPIVKCSKTVREEITRILYQNSTDDSECMRIRFEDMQNIIDQLNSLYD